MALFQRHADQGPPADEVVAQYATYDDYLDGQISVKDRYYLQDDDLARQLVELGYRGHAPVAKRHEFVERQRRLVLDQQQQQQLRADSGAAESATAAGPSAPGRPLRSAGHDLSAYPLLAELARREQDVLTGKLTTIIFIRDRNAKGQEISGYIDYGHRLKVDDFQQYFVRRRRLLPSPTDLSFHNWETQLTVSTSSPNFQVIVDDCSGIYFKNKRDRKVVHVDPKSVSGDHSTRTVIKTQEYIQVVIYDHLTRRNAE